MAQSSEDLKMPKLIVPLASPTLSLFHDDPYMKALQAFYTEKSPIPPPTIIPPSSIPNPQEFLSPKKQGLSSFSISSLPQAFEIGPTSGGAEDLATLTALSSLVSELVQKVSTLESELTAHKLLFIDVVGKLVNKVKALELKLKTRSKKFVLSD
ncbi:hypothetical protein Tco_0695843 [Tanacetum coccineum]